MLQKWLYYAQIDKKNINSICIYFSKMSTANYTINLNSHIMPFLQFDVLNMIKTVPASTDFLYILLLPHVKFLQLTLTQLTDNRKLSTMHKK